MAVRKIQPVHSGFAAVFALTLITAAPVLAAPDRNICDDNAAPTLDVTTTEFSSSTVTNESDAAEMMGQSFELASRESAEDESNASEAVDRDADESADSENSEAAVPAESGPLVHKRQMYRRDI